MLCFLGLKKSLTSPRLKLTAQGVAYRCSKVECEDHSAIQAPLQVIEILWFKNLNSWSLLLTMRQGTQHSKNIVFKSKIHQWNPHWQLWKGKGSLQWVSRWVCGLFILGLGFLQLNCYGFIIESNFCLLNKSEQKRSGNGQFMNYNLIKKEGIKYQDRVGYHSSPKT